MAVMDMKFSNRTKLSYIFLRVITKLSALDHKSRYYGTDQSLHHAEIHMIKSIRENEGIHVTGLADLLGVTKGAVSQILQKLSRKGMIVKDHDAHNRSKFVLRLTQKGETAYQNHEALHREFDAFFYTTLENASDGETAFLFDFLNAMDQKIDAFEQSD